MASLSIFDKTTQKTMQLVKQVQKEADIDDEHNAFQALRSTLHALRDRVPEQEAIDLGAQLPNLLAGFYYENWKPSQTPTEVQTKEEFLAPISRYLQDIEPQIDAEHAARAVFKVLNEDISEGEIEDVLTTLPRDIQELWPQEKVENR